MTVAELASASFVTTVVVTALLLGSAPVLAVRIATMLYPKGHVRRRELIAEMEHVSRLDSVPETWFWLGRVITTALFEGLGERRRLAFERLRARRQSAATRRIRKVYARADFVQLKVTHLRDSADGTMRVTTEVVASADEAQKLLDSYDERQDRPYSVEMRPGRNAPGRHKRTRRGR